MITSCNTTSKDSCGAAWIGGEVVNPKRDYVILSKSREILDTVYLDENNFFLYEISQVEPGIYFFSHNEYQALFVEPGDSIMLRVNTLEFDESLSFTGKGADKNSFMMELFLLNEQENELMPKFNLLSPAEFEQKIDSFAAHRKQLYSEFLASKSPSSRFKVIAEAATDYSLFAKKELYISANARKKNYDENVGIPESFYDFRNDVDLGNYQLRSYYPYYRYLRYYMDNLAYEMYKDVAPYNRTSFIHNYHKFTLIDSMITDQYLRNNLLRTSAYRYFLHPKNAEEGNKMLAHFLALNTNEDDHAELSKFAEANIRLTPGHTIPNVMLLTTENTVKDLHSVFNGPTVIYFWSNQSIKHYKNIHTRASELTAKYPEFAFIGINIDPHFKKWLKVIKNSGYDDLVEYQFDNFAEAEMKLIIESVNKAMIVDGDGTILNGNTNIFDIAIEDELLGFLNKS
ncbi:MAG: thioredoxin-like domain-containing protein [Bacteroidota bacterium]